MKATPRSNATPSLAAISGRRVAIYFVAIGFAFMFIESAFIQKLVRLLSHPLYAVAVVLCAFLSFAGLGSRFTQRLQGREAPFASHASRPGRNTNPRSVSAMAIVAIAAISLFYLFVLPALFPLLILPSDPARIVIAVLLVAPLAFAMGRPFPLGLSRIAAGADMLVPWAWGVNACTSVVAAVLATVLALHLGFTAVVVIAVLLYLAAAAAHP
ncbi:hypothetical protein [Paraburkholderia youngii]|uniref:hypothetical protein n=1 Tax=Paraburkholderia youngii TaxID=2782701 RepID=UPI003D1BC5CD